MDLISTLSLSLGAGWASGLNLYATVLVLGIMGASGAIHLPATLAVLQHPIVIAAAGIMYAVEFFVDKIPGLDSAWDAIHTFIRIPAGAILAAKAIGAVDPSWEIAAGLIGGTLAASTHATKAGSRALINTSPEPFSNWTASITEDLLVLGGLWTALHYPLVFFGLLLLFVLAAAWALPRLWRGIRHLGSWIAERVWRVTPAEADKES